MHQPNVFVNSSGTTMWDYETDAPSMWPSRKISDGGGSAKILDRNPEEASIRGLWSDPSSEESLGVESKLKDTQFADYHGHGWNFRVVFKRDPKGTLFDKDGKPVDDKDPKNSRSGAPVVDPPADLGMHCVDCHFVQGSHGNGQYMVRSAAAIEIDWPTATAPPTSNRPCSRPALQPNRVADTSPAHAGRPFMRFE